MDEPSAPPTLGTVTSTTLLARLRDPSNQTVWREYVERYRPPILGTLARAGLPTTDAEDVAQNALLAFSKAYGGGRYDRDKGRLRAWLFGIVGKELAEWRRRRFGRGLPMDADTPDSKLEALPAEDELAGLWEDEWRRAVLRQCFGAVRSEFSASTLEAFDLFVRRELPAREVAQRLGISENAVFGAKRRVLRRLRELEPLMGEIF